MCRLKKNFFFFFFGGIAEKGNLEMLQDKRQLMRLPLRGLFNFCADISINLQK